MRLKHLYLAFAATAALAGTAACAQDIKFGYNGDLSASPSAPSGQAPARRMAAAIEHSIAAAASLGRTSTLVTADDVSAPPESIQPLSALIDTEGVVAVFGPTNSGNAMAW